MHHKAFGGQAPSGPTGGDYSTPEDPQLDLWGNGRDEQEATRQEVRDRGGRSDRARRGGQNVRQGREGTAGVQPEICFWEV